jgi:hypothetical protein
MCASGPVYESFAKQHYGQLNQMPFEANRLCDNHGLDTNAILIILEWLDRCHKAGVLSERTCGLPPEDKLKALGLADVAADLYPYGGSPAGT